MNNKRMVHMILFCWIISVMAGMAMAAPADFFLDSRGRLHDQGGRVLTVDKPFSRIISLYGAHTETLYYLGAEAAVAGVSRGMRFSPVDTSGKPVFSYHDGPERFLAATPDLVLIRPMIDRGYTALMRQLEHNGITVISLQPGTVEEMYRYWHIMGRLTGRGQTARLMVQQFREAVIRFRSIAETVSPPKRVYFEAMHDQMKTISRGSMADFVLATAGGVNIADNAVPSRGTNIANYGKEKILARADQIDVYLAQRGPMNHPTRKMIKSEPGFSAIRAVQNNEIYIVEEALVSRPTIRLLQGIHRIGTLLYPEQYGAQWDQICTEALAPWQHQLDM